MKTFLNVVIGFLVVVFLLGIISSAFSSKSLAKKMDNNDKFHYQTSITSNHDNSDKAKVYTTDDSIRETALYLINEDRPIEYTDLNNDESIMLTYDDYYVLIYKGEDGDTYVQISSRKYVHNNGYYGLYRPYRHSIIAFYDTSYVSSRYYNRDIRRYGQGYSRSVKTVTKPVPSSTKTESKTDTKSKSNKIQTDKNASSKIRTNNNKSSSSTSSNSTNTSSKTKTSTTKTTSKPASKSSSSTTKSSSSSRSSSSGSVRTSSTRSRSSFGGGTSFGK